jgi:hypothetical protein
MRGKTEMQIGYEGGNLNKLDQNIVTPLRDE